MPSKMVFEKYKPRGLFSESYGMSFAKSWQEKACSSQAETWQVKSVLIKDFD